MQNWSVIHLKKLLTMATTEHERAKAERLEFLELNPLSDLIPPSNPSK